MKLQPSWNIISRESLRCTDIDFIFDFTQSSHLIVEDVGANALQEHLISSEQEMQVGTKL